MESGELNLIVQPLFSWFEENARDLQWRHDTEPYHVWLSEIMLQQTRVEAVKPYYARFLSVLPDIPALSSCSPDQLMKLWEGLGYYSRARNLQKAAQQIVQEYSGVFPEHYEDIRSLAGIGDYTAGAISSICFDLPEPAVDGNVLRVYTRLLCNAGCIDDQKVRRAVREHMRTIYEAAPRGKRGRLTQALMELGATVCVPNGAPHCDVCPLAMFCQGYQSGTAAEYPVRKEKKSRKIQKHTVLILQCGSEIAVRRRPSEGLLAGLWELPHLDGELDVQAAADAVQQWDAGALELCSVRHRTHIFTHIEWHMTCIHLQVSKKPMCFTWVNAEQLETDTALPTAFRICLPEEP